MEHKSKSQWLNLGGKKIYVRSKWEANYAHYLEWLKKQGQIKDWGYETKTFWFDGIKRGTVSYKPDFIVFKPSGEHYWVEVKGHYDQRSITKLKRFKKYFPNEILFVIDAKWFRANGPKLRTIVPGWETVQPKRRVIRSPPGNGTITAAEWRKAVLKVKKGKL